MILNEEQTKVYKMSTDNKNLKNIICTHFIDTKYNLT